MPIDHSPEIGEPVLDLGEHLEARARVGEQQPRGEPLEDDRLLGRDAEVAQLDLARRPREVERALCRADVVVLLGERKRAFARLGDAGGEGKARGLAAARSRASAGSSTTGSRTAPDGAGEPSVRRRSRARRSACEACRGTPRGRSRTTSCTCRQARRRACGRPTAAPRARSADGGVNSSVSNSATASVSTKRLLNALCAWSAPRAASVTSKYEVTSSEQRRLADGS